MSNRSRGGRTYRVMCEFRLPDDSRCVTAVQTMNQPSLTPTDIVFVYDPDRPEKALPYPSRMVKPYGCSD